MNISDIKMENEAAFKAIDELASELAKQDKEVAKNAAKICVFKFQHPSIYDAIESGQYFKDFCDIGEYFKDFVYSENGLFLTCITNVQDIGSFVDTWNMGQYEEPDDQKNFIISAVLDGKEQC
jgi:hypothetical protein